MLCSERIEGLSIDNLVNAPQDVRDWVGTEVMRLTLKELMEWQLMQTDPNPANFYFDPERRRLNLIDFGSARYYEDEFVADYVEILRAAQLQQKKLVREYSEKVRFLTGEENDEMLKAHVDSVLIVAKPFQTEGSFDFGHLGITDQIMDRIPVMTKNRLTPPPKPLYSLHRKLSGVYLTCISLRSKVPAKELFEEAYHGFINRVQPTR